MSNYREGTNIGTGRRKLQGEAVSYVMEAMPVPRGWNMTQPAAKGRGHLRLCRGIIPFVHLDLSLADRLYRPAEEPEPEPVSPVDLDPADRILRGRDRRTIHSRQSTVDLLELGRRAQSGNGRYASAEDRRLAAETYRSKRDIDRVRAKLKARAARMKVNVFEVAVITVFLILTDILPGLGIPLGGIRTPDSTSLLYPVISLVGICLASLVMFADVREGMRNLFARRFSTLTALAAAILAAMLHILYMLAMAFFAYKPVTATFAAPVCLALLVYTVNRTLHIRRVARGFALAIKKGVHHEVMSADDSPIAADLRHLSGSRSARIAYVVRTKKLSNYFSNACREDKCSVMMSRLYPVMLAVSLLAALIAGVRGYFLESDPVNTALSAFSAAMVTAVPVTGMLGLEIPLNRLTGKLRRSSTLFSGWNAADKFGDTDAFAINTTDLFPRGSIRVRRSFAVNDMEIEEITSLAASVLVNAGGALAEVFGELIRDDARLRQPVDSITYETEMGIAAWVKDKKVLVGNRTMMELHRVVIPAGGLARLDEFEAMRKNETFQMLYVAVNNRLMGVYMLEYKAVLAVREALRQLIEDGSGIMIYTCDANINIQLLKSVFDIPPRFLSVMENEGSSVYDSITFRVTESQDALISTDGTLPSLAGAIRTAVVLKDAEGMGLMIQRICFAMGMLFVAGLSCISPYAFDSVQIIIMQTVFLLLSAVPIVRSL